MVREQIKKQLTQENERAIAEAKAARAQGAQVLAKAEQMELRLGKMESTISQTVTDAMQAHLAPIAAELGVPMSTLALSWCLRRAEISSCIVGATRSAQLLENVAAVDFAWDDSIEAKVEAEVARGRAQLEEATKREAATKEMLVKAQARGAGSRRRLAARLERRGGVGRLLPRPRAQPRARR